MRKVVPCHPSFKLIQALELTWIDDFQLVHTNHGPVLYCFGDKWQFWLKIANSPAPPSIFNAPAEEVPLELCNGCGIKKN